MNPTVESLDFAERWLGDGMAVLRPAYSVYQVAVDMTNATALLTEHRRSGVQATATHLLIRAAGRALAANPALHQIVAGVRRHRPSRVDIGLSVSGETIVAPVLVVEGADTKSIPEIAAVTTTGAPEARQADARMLRVLRSWGWVLPFGWMRRALLRALFRNPRFRQKGVGSLQVSTVPTDWAFSAVFSGSGVLVGGLVRDRVIAVAGQPAVRPVMLLTLSADHAVWDARAAARFLSAVRTELESAGGDGQR